VSSEPILVGPTRAPMMPTGTRGSLAHDRAIAVAAISVDPAVVALGIDVEPAVPLDADMARIILRHDEIGLDAHVAFTLKEAAYKAWSNEGGPILDHHEVRLTVEPGRFQATVLADRAVYEGSWAIVAGRIVALVSVHR